MPGSDRLCKIFKFYLNSADPPWFGALLGANVKIVTMTSLFPRSSEINKRLHGMTVPQQEAVQGPWVAQRGQLLTHFAGITGPPQQSITEEWVCPLLWFSQPSHGGEKAVSNSVK